MMVSFFNQNHFKATDFYQPNFSRSRHALKSPYNSERINLEMQQFLYDVSRILTRIEDLEATGEDYFLSLNQSVNQDLSFVKTSFTGTETVNLNGIEFIVKKIEELENRLKVLEG